MNDDLRRVHPVGEDAFQIMAPEFAGWLLVVALILVAILEGK